LDKNDCETNPFLKARVKAYLEGLNRGIERLNVEKFSKGSEINSTFENDERATFKSLRKE
jgi:hypothetical protein